MTRDVVAIDSDRMLAVDETGFWFPITHRFDSDGDETDDWNETKRVVAGPDHAGKWWNFSIEESTRKPN